MTLYPNVQILQCWGAVPVNHVYLHGGTFHSQLLNQDWSQKVGREEYLLVFSSVLEIIISTARGVWGKRNTFDYSALVEIRTLNQEVQLERPLKRSRIGIFGAHGDVSVKSFLQCVAKSPD